MLEDGGIGSSKESLLRSACFVAALALLGLGTCRLGPIKRREYYPGGCCEIYGEAVELSLLLKRACIQPGNSNHDKKLVLS